MKNQHTIALVIIKNDDILGIYFYRVIYIRYSNYNRPWYFMYIQCGKWFLIRYLFSTKSLISVLNDILIILKNNIVHIVISQLIVLCHCYDRFVVCFLFVFVFFGGGHRFDINIEIIYLKIDRILSVSSPQNDKQ